MPEKLFSKKIWKNAVGASSKPKRLHLVEDSDGLFHCPVPNCDSISFTTKRGCRKHVFTKHGWYYFFETRPDAKTVLPEFSTSRGKLSKSRRSRTTDMPMFFKDCTFDKMFKLWLCSSGGGMKSYNQASQISCRVLKFLKFCCQDCCSSWDVPFTVVDFCLGNISSISDFIDYLRDQWGVGYAGVIGYMHSLSHVLDYRRIERGDSQTTFLASEIYIDRVKLSLSKKMRSEWNVLLSAEYLSKINCWATLDEMQNVIPYHTDKFSQILLNSSDETLPIAPHNLSFCTSFITAVFFIVIKATRPMTFQFLTVEMVQNIDESGMIDQTVFKTQEKYGFDTLIFSTEVIEIVQSYIKLIRPRLNPKCNYVLVTRNGTQLSRIGDVFGRIVFQAIGKYINPTRYRQIIETKSAETLNIEDQTSLSNDQKHTSLVAKIHYQKLKSRDVAKKGKDSMNKLRDEEPSLRAIGKVCDRFSNQNNESPPTSSSCTSFEILQSQPNHTITTRPSCKNNEDLTQVEQNPVTEIPALESNIYSTETSSVFSEKEGSNKRTRRKRNSFSSMEDEFLRNGYKKYGSAWTSILSDPTYKFHPSRQIATLYARAKKLNII